MPPAKKAATRRATSRSGSSSTKGISRRDVERATARFEKALDDASKALQSLGSDFGRGAKGAYHEVDKALKALRRDAVKANKTLMKDLEQVVAAATPARSGRRSTASKSSARSSSGRTASRTASKSTAAKRTTGRGAGSSAAKRPAASRRSS